MSWYQKIGKAYAGRVRRLNINIAKATLTNAVNGSAQTIAIGLVPAGAVIHGVAMRLNTQFTGGGASAVGVTLGDTASVSSLGSAIDAFGGTAGGGYIKPTTAGLRAGPYAAADTLNAIFTPDGAHNLAALTAGSIDFDITFSVPDVGTVSY